VTKILPPEPEWSKRYTFPDPIPVEVKMNASDRTTYTSSAGTIAVDQLTKQVLATANRLLSLPKFGGETPPMNGLQGCWRPWTSYSGPTHRGCGTVDVSPYNWRNRVVVLDLLGMVPFHRTRAQGDWPEHIHMVLDGMGCVDKYAQGQITSAKNGRDGLKGNHADPDAHLRSHLWPLAVFQGRTGTLTPTRPTRLYDGPSYSRQILKRGCMPKVTTVNALMEVSVARVVKGAVVRERWFVTDTGAWGYSGKWSA